MSRGVSVALRRPGTPAELAVAGLSAAPELHFFGGPRAEAPSGTVTNTGTLLLRGVTHVSTTTGLVGFPDRLREPAAGVAARLEDWPVGAGVRRRMGADCSRGLRVWRPPAVVVLAKAVAGALLRGCGVADAAAGP